MSYQSKQRQIKSLIFKKCMKIGTKKFYKPDIMINIARYCLFRRLTINSNDIKYFNTRKMSLPHFYSPA